MGPFSSSPDRITKLGGAFEPSPDKSNELIGLNELRPPNLQAKANDNSNRKSFAQLMK